jgi:hypothetical protein
MERIWKRTSGAMVLAFALATWSTSSFAVGSAEQRAACTPDVFRLCSSASECRSHRRLPQAAEAESEQALPGGDEFTGRQDVSLIPRCRGSHRIDIINQPRAEERALARVSKDGHRQDHASVHPSRRRAARGAHG